MTVPMYGRYARQHVTHPSTIRTMAMKKPSTMRMTSRRQDAKTEIFEMYGSAPDGKEMKMMEIVYTKKS